MIKWWWWWWWWPVSNWDHHAFQLHKYHKHTNTYIERQDDDKYPQINKRTTTTTTTTTTNDDNILFWTCYDFFCFVLFCLFRKHKTETETERKIINLENLDRIIVVVVVVVAVKVVVVKNWNSLFFWLTKCSTSSSFVDVIYHDYHHDNNNQWWWWWWWSWSRFLNQWS